ncbi:hypothetical protein AXF42_Ash017201 [Apostasia shenzhenica]|uniref:DUF4219 domain-containing protein n=1 Tax=Apostasia shenzhenica TaxID=1088818 RepID=A0A2H9ZVG6_9ASPA|nr:hypothetical protein AXF42_Ash017201 [Apostasia shenzhenica]
MATLNGNLLNVSQSLVPFFNGECFEFWKIKMRTFFQSQDLWELVSNGYVEPIDGEFHLTTQQRAELKETRKKDLKALSILPQTVHDSIFSMIAEAINAKEAWTILETEYQGTNKVITVNLQNLRRDFENLVMNDSESVQEFSSRVKCSR